MSTARSFLSQWNSVCLDPCTEPVMPHVIKPTATPLFWCIPLRALKDKVSVSFLPVLLGGGRKMGEVTHKFLFSLAL